MLLAEALRAGVPVEAVYAEGPTLDDPSVKEASTRGIRVRETAEGSLSKVLDLKSPRGIAAVARSATLPFATLAGAAVRDSRPLLVLVELQDPGNTGTLVRVAEATGCAGVVLTPGSVDLHNPKTVRATAGALFRVPVAEGVAVETLLEECDAAGIPTIATVGGGGGAPEEVPLAGTFALLIGAEAHGLPESVLDRSARRLTVPMEGQVESLNAAVAGSVILFEAARQRREWRRRGGNATQ